MNILLVSDFHHFSTKEIFDGYVNGFKKAGIKFDVAQAHDLRGGFFNDEMTWAIVLAKMLRADNAFTHILFVSGFSIPDWVLASKYDKKFGLIAVDDPHSSLKTLNKKKYFDFYFTNEKTLEDQTNGIYYVPTASGVQVPSCTKEEVPEQYRSDVVFVGTVYPNRVEPLETIAGYCKDKGLKFKCVGPSQWIPRDSELYKCFDPNVISETKAKLLYRGAKVVINLDRDVNWKSDNPKYNSLLVKRDEEPYSLNPRTYEIALCRSPQLFVDPRQEAIDIFGENAFYCKNNKDSIYSKMDEVLNLSKTDLRNKLKFCYETVITEHTYDNRAKQIIEILNEREKK